MYKKLTNPKEEEVSELLKEGYTLHSVTTESIGVYSNLIYHFVKYHYYNIGVDLARNNSAGIGYPPPSTLI